MLKKLVLFLLLLGIGPCVWAQSTTVSGQVTDAGGQSWNNGTITATFVPNPLYPTLPQYSWTGGALNPTLSGTLTATGSYSISIPSNTSITPINSFWQFKFCPQATSPCFNSANTTVTGGAQTVNATPPAISIAPGPGTIAYADAEIAGAVIGSQYFNSTIKAVKVCVGSPCTGANWGASSAPPTATVANLPTNVPVGTLYQVTDATVAGNCTAGGGSALSLCRWNGTNWVSIGDGGQAISGIPPIQLAVDSCVRANENPLSGGGTWTTNPGLVTPQGPMAIVSNVCVGTNNGQNSSYWTGANSNLFGTNQYAQVTLTGMPNGDGANFPNEGVLLRCQPAASSLECITIQIIATAASGGLGSGATTLTITSLINGSEQSIATLTNQTVNVGDILRGEAVGPNCTLKINGVVKLTGVCNSLAGGLPGIHTNATTTALRTATTMSNWSAGSLQPQVNATVSDQWQTTSNPLNTAIWTAASACGLQSTGGAVAEATTTGTDCEAIQTGYLQSDDQSSEIKLTALATGSFTSPLCHFGFNAGVGMGYFLRVPGPTGSAGSVLILRQAASGGFATLLTIASITPQVNDVFRITCQNVAPAGAGSPYVVVSGYQNGKLLGTVSDTATITTTSAVMVGAPGIHINTTPAVTSVQIANPWQSLSLGPTIAGLNQTTFKPSIVMADSEPAQTTALAAKTLFTVGPNTALFRVHVSVQCTTTSAAATATPSILFTDTSNTAQTLPGTAATCTTLNANSISSQDVTFRARTATAIQYSTAIANTPTYDISVVVEQLSVN